MTIVIVPVSPHILVWLLMTQKVVNHYHAVQIGMMYFNNN